MTILQPRASRVVQIIELALMQGGIGEAGEESYHQEIQGMIYDLGGRSLSDETTLAAATNYLLMLWLSKGCP